MQQSEYADLYLRLSLDREGKTAIERQEADCREWATRHGLKVREVHIDRGRSGFKTSVQRKGFDAALVAVTSGVVGTLIVWKLDRLSRQGIGQVGPVLDEIEKVNGRLVSVQDDLDTSNPEARRLIGTLSEIAQSESMNVGLRVRSAKAYLRTQGRWIGGMPPYGLANRDGRLHVDPETGPIVREMGRRILDGASLTKVTLWLNAEGIPSPRGGRWSVGSVSQLLRGPATAGLLPETLKHADGRYSGVVKPWRHPETGETISLMGDGEEPLISPADQARILSAFAARTMLSTCGKPAGQLSPESRHLLTGLLRCAGCGERMSMQGDSYRCQSARLGRTCSAPGGAYRQALDAAVTRAWMLRLTTADPDDPLLGAVADRWVAQHDPEAAAKRASVLAALSQEKAALAAFDDDFPVQRRLGVERYDCLSTALAKRIEGLQWTLDANPIPEADISPLLDPVLVREAWEGANIREQRELLRLALLEARISQGVRGRRFDPKHRLTFVWATVPPSLTGAATADDPAA